MKKIITLTLLLATLTGLASKTLATDDAATLVRHGTELRLTGAFDEATGIEQSLIGEFDVPVGHIFALNTIITHLTWDETQTQYDDALEQHADATLTWCNGQLGSNPNDTLANYYCGQAHFALAYYKGLKGSYYQAGKHGTLSIEYLETTLTLDPELIDAKMHLGVAYYIADNLPPFIRMFSRFLWFIPSGNSEKSLPYLEDVIESGDQYQDVARYIYSVVLLDDPANWPEATSQLRTLVKLYPQNPRFQLRLISGLMIQGDYEGTLLAANAYLNEATPPIEPQLSLAKIWMVRAHLGLNQPGDAAQIFDEIDPVFKVAKDTLPDWSIAWHMLNDGQLNDLANRREEAKATYNNILSMSRTNYINEVIVEAAREGLKKPYQLSKPASL